MLVSLTNGHTDNHEPSADLPVMEADKSMPIAVVGIGFRGPGDATSPESLCRMICERREAWRPIPEERWNNEAFFHPDHSRHGTINVEGGHFLEEDIGLFDAPFFNLTSAEASALDPQQRLLLEVTYESFENAGMPLEKVLGTKTSCYVGSFSGDYTDMLVRDPDCVPMYQCTNAGQSRAMTANRVSYFFDLKGPSVTVDTACSGSLVALHLACQSLRTGDAKVALAAGVNTILSHEFASTMSMMRFLSPDGRCYTFDERANGYARGEGVGCIVLKPLQDALANGDPIRAIIRGSGSNSDGRTQGITLPSGIAQEQLIRDTYQVAGLDPLETQFVECHGTGTQAGDPQETGALARVFCADRSSSTPLRIGSIKTNVGHLEGASGIAGAIKAILMLENHTFLPNRNFTTLNPQLQLDQRKLKIQLDVEDWKSPGPRRVSVNSFGYGGSNAHVIFENANQYLSARNLQGCTRKTTLKHRNPEAASTNGSSENSNSSQTDQDSSIVVRPRLFILSCFDENSGQQQVERLQGYLRSVDSNDEHMDDLAMTLNEKRSNFMWKLAVAGTTSESLVKALDTHHRFSRVLKRPTIGFIFTGQGAQWCGFGKELLDTFPVFASSIDRIGTYLNSLGAPFDLRSEMTRDPVGSLINLALYSQPVCSAVQIALVDLFESWGIRPASVTGHSSGELAAAYAAGALSMQDTMKAAYYRGSVSHNMQQSGLRKGAMMAVGMSESNVVPYLEALTRGVAVVACINSPSSLTISGDVAAVDELKSVLDQENIFARKLIVEMAYHSPHMEFVADEYRELLEGLSVQASSKTGDPVEENDVQFFSSVHGRKVDFDELEADYWVSNMLGQVKFAEALRLLCLETSDMNSRGRARQRKRRTGAAAKVSVDILVEIGPHSALAGPIKQVLKAEPKIATSAPSYVASLVRGQSAVTTTLKMAGTLIAGGYPVDTAAINRPRDVGIDYRVQPLVDLPPYAWNHTNRYWAEPRISKVYRNRKFPRTDLLGALDRHSSTLEPRWRNYLRLSEIPWVRDHKIQSNIVFPAAAYIAMAVEAASQIASLHAETEVTGYCLREVTISAALILNEQAPAEVTTWFRPPNTTRSGAVDRWHHFSICSVTEDNRWTEHCHGLIRVQLATAPEFGTDQHSSFSTQDAHNDQVSARADSLCKTTVNARKFYQHLNGIGLEYCDTFAGITSAKTGSPASCIAAITVTDTAATMPMGFQYPLVIHPTTLDAVFHSIFVALSSKKWIENAAVPTSIGSLDIAAHLAAKPGDRLRVFTTAEYSDAGHVVANLAVKEDGIDTCSVTIRDLKLTVLEKEQETSIDSRGQRFAYQLDWQPDVDLLSHDQAFSLLVTESCTEEERQILFKYEAAAYQYIFTALQAVQPRDIPESLTHLHKQYEVLSSLFKSFENVGHEVALSSIKASGPEGKILADVGEQLPEILRGTVDTWSIISSRGLLESYWSQTPRLLRGYRAASRYLTLLAHQNPQLSILEIHSGSGSATLPILESLTESKASFRSYTVTNPGSEHSDNLEAKLEPWKSFIRYAQLDIQQDVKEQGFEEQHFDVVILAHGTTFFDSPDIALQNARTLLGPGGKLVLIDDVVDASSLVQAMTFGFLPHYSASRYPPVRSEQYWQAELSRAGFSGIEHYIREPDPKIMTLGYSLIVSGASDDQTIKPEVLLITTDPLEGTAKSLKNRLEKAGLDVQITTLLNAEVAGKVCIVLNDLRSTVLGSPDTETWYMIKEIFLRSTGVLWVGRGGAIHVTNPNAALSIGLARTARSETGDRPIVTLNICAATLSSHDATAEVICKIFKNRFTREYIASSVDTEYAECDGLVMIPRIVENDEANAEITSILGQPEPIEYPFHSPDRRLQAIVQTRGQPETIAFVDAENGEDLPPDHIEIEVAAFGLNRQDLDMASTAIPRAGGMIREVCGTVSAIGKNVSSLKIGDEVAYLGLGNIANTIRDHAACFQALPGSLPMDLAAGFLVAYCTAYYSVYHLARVEKGETVLINNAWDPVGQAILELCQLAGATVIAVVEFPEQKSILQTKLQAPADEKILVYSEKSFSKIVNGLTDESGVDVVFFCLPSATGEMHRLSWGCLSPFGRFIELSASDPTNDDWLEMGNFAKDATYSAFDFAHLVAQKRSVSNRILSRVLGLFRAGVVEGLMKPTFYDISDLGVALQNMHTGLLQTKAVVVAGQSSVIKAIPRDMSHQLLRPDASYLLVGGMGGIGRATAFWMLAHGARNIIFANRSGMSKAEARETVQALEAQGACVAVFRCDVGNGKHVSDMLVYAKQHMPPIKGVIQGAMVLRDTMLEKLEASDYNAVVQPKFQGTWNLHNSLPQDLDFFVMLSSISGIIGNTSQAAYAAGNSFMDAFAAYRNSLGLPAVTLDLGVIAGIGYLSENTELASAMAAQGFEATDPTTLMALIQSAISRSRRDGTTSQVITGLGTWKAGQSLGNFDAPLFADFRRIGLQQQHGRDGGAGETNFSEEMRRALRAAQELDEAAAIICTALIEKLASRLGVPASNVVSDNSVAEYGVDSLVGVEMRNWIAKELEAQIPMLEILANQSVVQLAGKIARKSKLVKIDAGEE